VSLNTPNRKALVVALASVVVAAAAWFLLIGPKRSEAANLDSRIDEVNNSIVAARAANRVAQQQSRELAPLFLLARAMPERNDMAGTIDELNRLSRQSGLAFVSITPTPQPDAAGTSSAVVPVQLAFTGRFGSVSEFLRRLREQVSLKNGSLAVRGRLYTVESFELAEGPERLPQLNATMQVNVHAYSGAAAAQGGSAAAPASGTEQVAQGPS
jgi:Tfp pilus assembly protein PilO